MTRINANIAPLMWDAPYEDESDDGYISIKARTIVGGYEVFRISNEDPICLMTPTMHSIDEAIQFNSVEEAQAKAQLLFEEKIISVFVE